MYIYIYIYLYIYIYPNSSILYTCASNIYRCEDIELDLRNIALKLNNSNVESAVVCMVDIAVRVTNNTNSLLSLLQKCYEGIMGIIRHYENNPGVKTISGDIVSSLCYLIQCHIVYIAVYYVIPFMILSKFLFAHVECASTALSDCIGVRLGALFSPQWYLDCTHGPTCATCGEYREPSISISISTRGRGV